MLDSYEKLALNYWLGKDVPETMKSFSLIKSELFKHVHKKDLPEVVVIVTKYMLIDNFEYDDNYRLFPFYMEKQYKEQSNKGCCGFFDTFIKTSHNRKYLFGFNYGH